MPTNCMTVYSAVYNSQEIETMCPFTDECIKKCVHIHNWILFSHKKNKILSSVIKQIEPEIIMLREAIQTHKNKDHTISLRRNLKNVNVKEAKIALLVTRGWGKNGKG